MQNLKIKQFITILFIVQMVVGTIWILLNINKVPHYGDTPEYIHLSLTLDLDKYRTILYPIFLKYTILLSTYLNIPYHVIVYIIQMIVSFISIYSLFYMFAYVLKKKNKICSKSKTLSRKEWLTILFLTFFVFTNPLTAHFNLSVLTDSLALSFTLLFISFIVHLCNCNNDKILLNIILASLFFVLMSITRPERVVIGALFIGVLTLYELVRYIKNKDKVIAQKTSLLLVVLIIGLVFTQIINTNTQNHIVDSNRVQPSISRSLYERIVWPRLSGVYNELPDSIKQVISYEEAISHDQSVNNTNMVMKKLLDYDKGSWNSVHTITKIAFLKYYLQIILSVSYDSIKNIFTPLTFTFNKYMKDQWIDWTMTRMSEFHPMLSNLYIKYFKILLIIMLSLILVKIKTAYNFVKNTNRITSIIIIFALTCTIFFVGVSNLGYHIRYSMPIYITLIILITELTRNLFPNEFNSKEK
ncbi:hypothetical protein [Paenibacillus agricola]|uniref:Dolichyl-phosphate-mannose-protein mannosyltransferase n=1 Tax=Paenibacillus agricola TaxID=2716264 RepID=A0ABX0JKA4_9BACL|nr:hypothetical protein [Paenibacillus agricola]NHN34305.1 hypothetical protein [Paenibacillus agricola]